MYSLLSFFLLVVLTVLSSWLMKIWRTTLPPGPFPLPFIGNLHQIAWRGIDNMQLTFIEWSRQYGDVFTVYIGWRPWVILSSYDVIKDAFAMAQLSGRPRNFITDVIGQQSGIASSEGRVWRDQRRFALTHLREFGFGKVSFESKVQEEVTCLMTKWRQFDGRPFDIQFWMTNSVTNLICSIILGRRFDYEDQRFLSFLHRANDSLTKANRAFLLIEVFPFLRYVPGDVLGVNSILKDVEVVEMFFKEIIAEHKATYNSGNMRDFIDTYLKQIDSETKSGKTDSTFSEFQLLRVLMDLFVAGMDTVTTTIRWTLLFLILHPEVQEKARLELDRVVGQEKLPSVKDRSKLPYIEALITESQRVARINGFGLGHKAMEEVTLKGFQLPTGTAVSANIAALLLDEKQFPNPTRFYPERFLDESGQFVKPETVIPFGTGRRVCLGEALGRMELFIYVTTMLHNFTFSLPPRTKSLPTKGVMGFAYAPLPYEVLAIPRI